VKNYRSEFKQLKDENMTIVRARARSAGWTQYYRKRCRNGFKTACVIKREAPNGHCELDQAIVCDQHSKNRLIVITTKINGGHFSLKQANCHVS
jgi:hypothetical protein